MIIIHLTASDPPTAHAVEVVGRKGAGYDDGYYRPSQNRLQTVTYLSQLLL